MGIRSGHGIKIVGSSGQLKKPEVPKILSTELPQFNQELFRRIETEPPLQLKINLELWDQLMAGLARETNFGSILVPNAVKESRQEGHDYAIVFAKAGERNWVPAPDREWDTATVSLAIQKTEFGIYMTVDKGLPGILLPGKYTLDRHGMPTKADVQEFHRFLELLIAQGKSS